MFIVPGTSLKKDRSATSDDSQDILVLVGKLNTGYTMDDRNMPLIICRSRNEVYRKIPSMANISTHFLIL